VTLTSERSYDTVFLPQTSLTWEPAESRSRYNLNETLQSWCYAQELETVEHAFMNVVTTLCGQVRPYITDVKLGASLIRHPYVGRKRGPRGRCEHIHETPGRKLTDKAAHCALGSALSTI